MNHITQNQDPLGDYFEFKDSVILLKSNLEKGNAWSLKIKEEYPNVIIRDLKNAERVVYFPGQGLWQIFTHMNIASVIPIQYKDCKYQTKIITDYLGLSIKRNSPSYKIANLVGYNIFFYLPSSDTESRLSSIFTSKGDVLTKNCFGNDMGGPFKEFSAILKFNSDWKMAKKEEKKSGQVENIFTPQKDQGFTFTPSSTFPSSQAFNFSSSPDTSAKPSSTFTFGSQPETKPTSSFTFDSQASSTSKPSSPFTFTPQPVSKPSSTFTFGSQTQSFDSQTPSKSSSSSTFAFGSQTPSKSSSSPTFAFGSQAPSSSFGSIFSSNPDFGKQLGFGKPSSNASLSNTPATSGFKFY